MKKGKRAEAHDAAGYESDWVDFTEYDDGYGNNVTHGDLSMQRMIERGGRDPWNATEEDWGEATAEGYDKKDWLKVSKALGTGLTIAGTVAALTPAAPVAPALILGGSALTGIADAKQGRVARSNQRGVQQTMERVQARKAAAAAPEPAIATGPSDETLVRAKAFSSPGYSKP